MIQTTIANLDRYASLHPAFPAAFEALKALKARRFAAGRYDVNGDRIFVNAAQYDTHPVAGAFAEAHRQYIDVMYLVSGQEQLAYYPTAGLTEITAAYDEAGDYLLAEIEPDSSFVQFFPGTVVILFPEDSHAPGLDLNGTHKVQKFIVKVRI